ncbi:MAG: hypothetical protein E7773_14795 [Sphingomonas sp.]|uniref:hypothetical protein n=1 Tax=Sphingomonas sp. TaxID=28214 RepID=UPI001214552F|nr:hypothetical protein [Sphingomonas sp.]THD34454.1 MAG: hypothetical protein E7773_14795 [Sphingomonas sp.]
MSEGQYDWKYPVNFQGGIRDWDWHASDVEPDGRILMPLNLLHPDDGHVADAEGMVDITGLQGTLVRMRRYGVMRLLHLHWARWPMLESVHPMPTSGGGRKVFHHFDPATRMSDIYDAWEGRLEEPTTMAAFAFARDFHRYANPPDERLPPRVVLTAAARAMTHNPVRGGDLRQFMLVRRGQLPRLLAAIRAEREDIAAAGSAPKFDAVTEAQMAGRASFLAGLANSCLDPEADQERFVAPDATSLARLDRITVGFAAAAAFVYSKAPVMRSPAMLPRYLRGFHRFVTEAVAENPAFDIAVVADIDRAFEHVAFGELRAISGSRGWRDRMVQDAASVMRHARRAMTTFDPDGTKGVAPLAPAEQSDRDGFLQRVKDEYAADRAGYGASRTKFANRIKNAYDRVIDAAAHRILQIKHDGEAGRAAIDHLCSAGGQQLAYWDVFVPGPELSETGHPTGRLQVRRYRWWRLKCAWRSLLHDRHWSQEPAPDVWHDRQANAGGDPVKVRNIPTDFPSPDFHGGEFVCEHLSTTVAEQPGIPSIPPLLATLATHHILADPGYLDVDQRELREKLLRSWRIPRPHTQARGLLQFDSGRARLARLASRSDREHRRTFVPHEEAEHALRLAAHGVDATAQTWCRQSEFLQQVEYADRWEDPAGTGVFGWFASRKLHRRDPIGLEQFLECDEDHYLESVELLGLTTRRCRLAEPEIVPPFKSLAWKLDDGPYVFAFDGAVVTPVLLRGYLNILLANVAEARFHDLRAGASNRSRMKNAPLAAIGEGLGQRSAGFIELYSGLTPEQLEEQADEVRTQKVDRIEADRQRRTV